MAKTFTNPLARQSAGTTATVGENVTLLLPTAIRTDGGESASGTGSLTVSAVREQLARAREQAASEPADLGSLGLEAVAPRRRRQRPRGRGGGKGGAKSKTF